jgi:hypothetical protein
VYEGVPFETETVKVVGAPRSMALREVENDLIKVSELTVKKRRALVAVLPLASVTVTLTDIDDPVALLGVHLMVNLLALVQPVPVGRLFHE